MFNTAKMYPKDHEVKKSRTLSAKWGSIIVIRESECKNCSIESNWNSTVIVVPDNYDYDDVRLTPMIELAKRNSELYQSKGV